MINDYWSIEYNDKTFFNIKDAASSLKDEFKNSYINFYDKTFSQYDWSIEPSESFEDLKKTRAKQLRDQYPYLRLYSSFASDSGTMVNTFLKSNLFIDEIVNFATIYEKELPPFDQERNTLSIPKIKEFIKFSPRTKIIMKNIGVSDVVEMMKSKNKNASNPLPSRYNLSSLSTDLRLDRVFGDVIGDQKPWLFIENGNFYTGFSLPYIHDTLCRGEVSENFFTTPNFPLLHIKQCHLLKNKIKKEKSKLIENSWIHPVFIVETRRFDDGSLMETFIENSCRDFTDFQLTSIKTHEMFSVLGTLQHKDLLRIKGFYKSAKNDLKDYYDFVKEFLSSSIFEMNKNKTMSKVLLNYKKYYLGN